MKRSRTWQEEHDAEANFFAMCLLMPGDFVRDWAKKYAPNGFQITGEEVKLFAKDFGVSETMAVLRLADLGLGFWNRKAPRFAGLRLFGGFS
jgi:Zn-dependent peptidase ImmA (M78 family)